jgi:hypothetical protein
LAEGSLDYDYLRSVDGEYTTFRISGATDAVPYGINDAGAMAGYGIQHSSGVYGGFIRESDGSITVFQAPGAGVGSGEGTKAFAINASGTVAGQYYDGSNGSHGFLRYSSASSGNEKGVGPLK